MCVCVYVCVRVYDMIHLLLYQLRPCYDIVLLCCTVNSYILYVRTYMCGSLHMRICVLEFCGYYIHTFVHIWQVSFVFTMFVTAMRQKPHYYVIPIPNVIILFGKLHPNGHLVSQKFIQQLYHCCHH